MYPLFGLLLEASRGWDWKSHGGFGSRRLCSRGRSQTEELKPHCAGKSSCWQFARRYEQKQAPRRCVGR